MGSTRPDPDGYLGHDIYRDRYTERDTPIPTEELRNAAEFTSGSGFELFAAALAAVFAVLGLAGVAPLELAAFATIAVGFALFAHGSTIANRWSAATHLESNERTHLFGIGTEVLGGFIGGVLGLLAVIGVARPVVLPISMLVLGAALVLGGPSQPALAEAIPAQELGDRRWYVTRDAVRASGGVMVMSGVAAVVLGILALLGGPRATLSLVAILCLAAGLIVAAGALIGRIARRFA